MKIHEYQGKELFRKFGMVTPRGFACFSVDEAVEAAKKLGGSVWVVKAQNPRRRPRQGRRRQGCEIAGRGAREGETDPRHAARHASDGPGGQKVRRCWWKRAPTSRRSSTSAWWWTASRSASR
jgi:succinyl-CoA synthetase beta subunit